MTKEESLELAEKAAAFMQELVKRSVPLPAAIAMATAFVSASILGQATPKEPWER